MSIVILQCGNVSFYKIYKRKVQEKALEECPGFKAANRSFWQKYHKHPCYWAHRNEKGIYECTNPCIEEQVLETLRIAVKEYGCDR